MAASRWALCRDEAVCLGSWTAKSEPEKGAQRPPSRGLRADWEALTCQELSDAWAMYYASSPAACVAFRNAKSCESGATGSNGSLGRRPHETVCPCHAAPSLWLGLLRPVPLNAGPYTRTCAEMDTFATALDEHRSSMRAILYPGVSEACLAGCAVEEVDRKTCQQEDLQAAGGTVVRSPHARARCSMYGETVMEEFTGSMRTARTYVLT